jgi:methylated-DNA-[protein]-cysteine S-methyltransferase
MRNGAYFEVNLGGLVTRLAICVCGEKLTGLSFGDTGADCVLEGNPPPETTAVIEAARRQVGEYALGRRRAFDIPLSYSGTDFQMRVWNVLLQIPYGETWTYGDVARAAGNAAAYRAAGGAIHNNPIAIIIPCHRVIGADGSLTGFGGGLPIKKRLLQIERSRQQ